MKGQKQKLINISFPLMIGILYILDQRLNGIIGLNVGGEILYILLTIPVTLVFINRRAINRYNLYIVSLVTIYSLSVNLINSECDNNYQMVGSLIFLWAITIASMINPLTNLFSKKYITTFMLILFTIMNLINIIDKLEISNLTAIGLFNEPSHFALYYIPVIAYRLYIDPTDRIALISVFSALASLFSSTLLVGLIIIIIVAYRINLKILFTILLLAGSVVISNFATPTKDENSQLGGGIIERISDIVYVIQSGENTGINLSSLVWINGWSQAFDTMISTSGLGLGFNQMGCGQYEFTGVHTEVIRKLTGGITLNARDGSLLAAKVIAEFGFLGVIIVAVAAISCVYWVLELKNNHKIREKVKLNNLALKAAGATTLLVLLFVRSASYFMFPLMLSITMMLAPSRS